MKPFLCVLSTQGEDASEVSALRKAMDAAKKAAGASRGTLFYKVTVKVCGFGFCIVYKGTLSAPTYHVWYGCVCGGG